MPFRVPLLFGDFRTTVCVLQDLILLFTTYVCLTTYFVVYFEYICIRTGFVIGKWKDVHKAEKVQIRVYIWQLHSLQKANERR